MTSIKGTRRDYDVNQLPNPGEYGKLFNGDWYGVVPLPRDEDGFVVMANLSKHEVVENADGTITVSPSILIGPTPDGRTWHGFLKNGVWQEIR